MLRLTTELKRSMERRSGPSSWEAGVIPQLDSSQGATIEDDRLALISKYADSQMTIQLGDPSSSDHLAENTLLISMIYLGILNKSRKSVSLNQQPTVTYITHLNPSLNRRETEEERT